MSNGHPDILTTVTESTTRSSYCRSCNKFIDNFINQLINLSKTSCQINMPILLLHSKSCVYISCVLFVCKHSKAASEFRREQKTIETRKRSKKGKKRLQRNASIVSAARLKWTERFHSLILLFESSCWCTKQKLHYPFDYLTAILPIE